MTNDRISLGVPSTSPCDPQVTPADPASNGFLLDESMQDAPPTLGPVSNTIIEAGMSTPLADGSRPDQAAAQSTAPEAAMLIRIIGAGAVIIVPFIALDADSSGGLIAALLLFVGGLFTFFYLGSAERLRRDQIVDRWDMLIDGAHGHADEVLHATIAGIDAQEITQIRRTERRLATRLTRAETRPFLIVTHDGSGRLRPYRVHVNVRDYGSSLQANWYLSYHRGFFEKLTPNPLIALDLFDEQDLRAYVTTVHRCLVDAVVDLLVGLGKDTVSIERNSRGFLGIS